MKAMYGTRDAAACWASEVARVFVSVLGLVQGKANPCHLFHQDRQVRASVHGDDVERMASYCHLVWLKEVLAKEWMIEYKGILAPPGRADSIQEVCHLRRTLRWTAQGIEWEHDSKHIDRIPRFAGLVHGSKVATPLVRERLLEGEDPYGVETDIDLPVGEVTGYRSCAMTVAYVAHDRTDLQRTVRELAKGLSQPKQRHMLLHLQLVLHQELHLYFRRRPCAEVRSMRSGPKTDHRLLAKHYTPIRSSYLRHSRY